MHRRLVIIHRLSKDDVVYSYHAEEVQIAHHPINIVYATLQEKATQSGTHVSRHCYLHNLLHLLIREIAIVELHDLRVDVLQVMRLGYVQMMESVLDYMVYYTLSVDYIEEPATIGSDDSLSEIVLRYQL